MSNSVHQFTNPMKMQILRLRQHWTPLSRLLAQVTKPFTAFLLIILTFISVATIRPVLSQAVDNSQASDAKEAIKLPLIIFRERLNMVNNSEQISFQPVGIGESFAVLSGSPIIIGNPPYPYQITKAYFYDKKTDNKSELKEIIRKDGERSSIILDPKPNSPKGELVIEASPPTITTESTSSGNAAATQVLNTSNSIHFEIKNAPEFVGNSNIPNENQTFSWNVSPDILQITNSGNINQFGTLSLKSPPAPSNAKEIHLTVSLGRQVIGRVELKQTANPNEWIVNKTDNMLKTNYYHRSELSISNSNWSRFCALMTGLLSYAVISLAVFWYRTHISKSKDRENKNISFHDFNPLFIASGTNGKVSLSRLQLLWFTILVMSILVLLFVQTGSLSDLPESVLALLGVSASGTILSGLTNANKNRLSFENWQWLKDQGWLYEKPTPTRWTDLFLDDDGSLNIYKFQLLFSSILVGITLVLSGGNNLLGFKIPENFPQLLGLSNIAYVLGKVVTPTGMPELNEKISELVTLEKELKASTTNSSTPNLNKLTEYFLKAKNVAGMTKAAFADLGGTKFDYIEQIKDEALLPPWASANLLIPLQSASPVTT